MGVLRQRVGAIGAVLCLAFAGSAASGQTAASDRAPVIPPTASALEGVPAVRLDATKDDAKRRLLDRGEAAKDKLEISIVKGQYFWTSRGNQPLMLRSSGEFTYLSSASDPGQYVRFQRINDRLTYVEHVDSALGSVTYWGELRILLGK